jgi:hypothetical protein
MICVQVTDRQNVQPADTNFGFFQAKLSTFTGVKKVYLAVNSHRQRGEEPVRHGHHAAATEKNAFHLAPPRKALSAERIASVSQIVKSLNR